MQMFVPWNRTIARELWHRIRNTQCVTAAVLAVAGGCQVAREELKREWFDQSMSSAQLWSGGMGLIFTRIIELGAPASRCLYCEAIKCS